MIRAVALLLLLLLYTFTWLSTYISLYATHNCVAAAVIVDLLFSKLLLAHTPTNPACTAHPDTQPHTTHYGTCTTSTVMMMIANWVFLPYGERGQFFVCLRALTRSSCLSCVAETIFEVESKITTIKRIIFTQFSCCTREKQRLHRCTYGTQKYWGAHTTCTRDTDTVRTRYWKSCGFPPTAEYCCNFDGAR